MTTNKTIMILLIGILVFDDIHRPSTIEICQSCTWQQRLYFILLLLQQWGPISTGSLYLQHTLPVIYFSVVENI